MSINLISKLRKSDMKIDCYHICAIKLPCLKTSLIEYKCDAPIGFHKFKNKRKKKFDQFSSVGKNHN